MNDKPRFRPAPVLMPQSARKVDRLPERMGGLGLTSERTRAALVQKLKAQGIATQPVLDVIGKVPRHQFVDEAFASRAYEDAALPIGHQQTISRPFTVARFAEYALNGKTRLGNVLEVGAGCGYQAAVFAEFCDRLASIERIEGLYQKARKNLKQAGYTKVKVVHGDGLAGLPEFAPFDVIVVAAAGLEIPSALLKQLKIGGRLIVPVADQRQQVLVTVDRQAENKWHRENRDLVKFVPLVQGISN
ncbi:protein-L-isoaspartate(D-aspartate) O-methyltransferase [Limnobacter litoralis]|uniref:Protein-L-isoaspartate O-methyltransferase n=1 Tax=Limnobacter litoralis TaxID=481366 RepID=A0ABQ5YPU8_9BURK|nr:protein-L-isoaspartate(D-aspartate) O-methyltransferase [Limnobacter litoralis]GLR25810.1 protein-L-isoaspartate O-methyltransferase [Limnobacter litoralis]